MTNEIIKDASVLSPGDIIAEIPDKSSSEDYVAIYLIVGKLIEREEMDLHRFDRTVTYFKTYLLYVGKEYDSAWSKHNSAGDSYLLSEHEVANYHDWIRLYKSELPWKKGVNVEESGVTWDKPDY